METYEIGTASVEITPPVGTPLAGNFRDDYASRGVHTPLRSRSIVIASDDGALAIISNDLLGMPAALAQEVRRQVASRCELPAERILVAATHTHSGPDVGGLTGQADAAAVQAFLAPRMAEGCVKAYEVRKPAHLWFAIGREERVCFNRRLRLRDGRTVMNWTAPPRETIDRALGPVDPEIGILCAGEALAAPALVAANLALHAAVLAGDNWLMGPDWPGYYYEAVQKALGEQAMGVFLQGTEGNVNHIDARDPLQGRGYKEAQRIGSLVGLAVVDALRGAAPVAGPVGASTRTISVPSRTIPPEQLAWARGVVEAATDRPKGTVDGIPDLIFAQDQIEMAARTEPFELEIQVFRVGQVAVVGLPGEFFVEFGLEIKERSPAEITLVVGLANGSVGYVPTAEAFEQGGYEPTAWRHSRLAPGAGSLCVEAALEQVRTLFR